MKRTFFGAAVLSGLLAGPAAAQVPGGYNPYAPGGGFGGGTGQSGFGGGFGPNSGYGPYNQAANIYNRATQPLSPYLNLLRGGNPAVNFFYGVRPGLGSGQPLGQGFGGAGATGFSQLRTGFLPGAANPTQEPVELPVAGVELPSLPPSGHPVAFSGSRGVGAASAPRSGVFGSKPPQSMQRPTGRP